MTGLKPLKPLDSFGFSPIEGGGGGYPSGGGPVIGYNPPGIGITIGGPSGSPGKTVPGATSASFLGGASSFISCFTSPLDCLLRLAFFLLGLIAIIGAIYLYKPSVVTTPIKAATDAAKGAAA